MVGVMGRRAGNGGVALARKVTAVRSVNEAKDPYALSSDSEEEERVTTKKKAPAAKGGGRRTRETIDKSVSIVKKSAIRRGGLKSKKVECATEDGREEEMVVMAPPKRRGRPRKVECATEDRRRDDEVVVEKEEPAPLKRGRGRPRKVECATQDRRGEDEEEPAPPKRRGRPRKVECAKTQVTPVNCGRGRPKKTNASADEVEDTTPVKRVRRGKRKQLQEEEADAPLPKTPEKEDSGTLAPQAAAGDEGEDEGEEESGMKKGQDDVAAFRMAAGVDVSNEGGEEELNKDEEEEEGEEVDDLHAVAAPGTSGYFSRRRRGTSKRSVKELKLVDEDTVRQVLAKLPTKHFNEKAKTKRLAVAHFPQWRRELDNGNFNLLFYGFGSKRDILEEFAASTLTDGAVVVAKGYSPSITVKQILVSAVEAFYDQGHEGTFTNNSKEALLASLKMLLQQRGTPIYFVIHNIDSPNLRTSDSRAILNQLAMLPNVHIVASVDHMNAALLWDRRASSQFRWLWREIHTYAPYEDETRMTPHLLVGEGHHQAARGAAVVMRSLTPNARAIFGILAEAHIDKPGEGGMQLEHLYRVSREQFLCSSEDTLKAYIREFRDHELVRVRRGPQGQDIVTIAVEECAVRDIVRDLKTIEE